MFDERVLISFCNLLLVGYVLLFDYNGNFNSPIITFLPEFYKFPSFTVFLSIAFQLPIVHGIKNFICKI